jgi:hypothetical protein
VAVPVEESKIKPRRGNTYNWTKVPTEIRNRIQLHTTDGIEEILEDRTLWYKMIHPETSIHNPTTEAVTTHNNRFAILSEEVTFPTPPE